MNYRDLSLLNLNSASKFLQCHFFFEYFSNNKNIQDFYVAICNTKGNCRDYVIVYNTR